MLRTIRGNVEIVFPGEKKIRTRTQNTFML